MTNKNSRERNGHSDQSTSRSPAAPALHESPVQDSHQSAWEDPHGRLSRSQQIPADPSRWTLFPVRETADPSVRERVIGGNGKWM